MLAIRTEMGRDKAVEGDHGFWPEHHLEGGHGGLQAAHLLHRGRDQKLFPEVHRAT